MIKMDKKSQAIVSLWTFIHQPIEFNKYTFKRTKKEIKRLNNSLKLHAEKHPEIVSIGRKLTKCESDILAYKHAMQYLAKHAYNLMRKHNVDILANCNYCKWQDFDFGTQTCLRTRLLFTYENNIVVIIIDNDITTKYKRRVTGVTCYFKTDQ
jgi:hypothetical protein